MSSQIEIFCCYAHKDKPLLVELRAHLIPLQRQGLITLWADTDINAGAEWEEEIDKHLNTAQIILLLVSPDFMASEYCYSIEMQRAIERHSSGEAHVIPIILRPSLWQSSPLEKLQAIPTNGKPVTRWGVRDEAFIQVARSIQKVVDGLLKERWLMEGKAFHEVGKYQEALAVCEKAIELDPNNAQAYYEKGITLRRMGQFTKALAALEKAIELDPNNAQAYYEKGVILHRTEELAGYLAAFEQNIQLDPDNSKAFDVQGTFSRGTESYIQVLAIFEQALGALEKAIQLDPNNAHYHCIKGYILCKMDKYNDALDTYRHAIRLNSEDLEAHIGLGDAFLGLNRLPEALKAYINVTKLQSTSRIAYFKIGLVYERLAQEAYNIANLLENEPE